MREAEAKALGTRARNHQRTNTIITPLRNFYRLSIVTRPGQLSVTICNTNFDWVFKSSKSPLAVRESDPLSFTFQLGYMSVLMNIIGISLNTQLHTALLWHTDGETTRS